MNTVMIFESVDEFVVDDREWFALSKVVDKVYNALSCCLTGLLGIVRPSLGHATVSVGALLLGWFGPWRRPDA